MSLILHLTNIHLGDLDESHVVDEYKSEIPPLSQREARHDQLRFTLEAIVSAPAGPTVIEGEEYSEVYERVLAIVGRLAPPAKIHGLTCRIEKTERRRTRGDSGGVKELYARAQRPNGKVEEAHEVVPVWVIENLRLETDATIGSMLGRLPTKLNSRQKAQLHKEIRRWLAIRL